MIVDFLGILAIVNLKKSKKAAKLTTEEEYEEIIDDVTQNKTLSIKKKIEKNCRKLLTICCFIYFICISFNIFNWNYDLFSL